ncbi:MAG TPA: hypothetical protein VIY52_09675 [Streptosporangiaceae bacterium]
MTKLGRRVLHAGLMVEATGLLAVYAVLRGAGGGVSTVDLLAPMVIGGIGMGMVFVPLFDIVMAGVRPQEMGSASGVLQTVNSLGMSPGIAGIGAIFFALAGARGLSSGPAARQLIVGRYPRVAAHEAGRARAVYASLIPAACQPS